MMKQYPSPMDPARAHAQRKYEFHMAEARRHKSFLDAENAREAYLRQENIAAASVESSVDNQGKEKPSATPAQVRYGLPLGNKEVFYDQGVVEALSQHGSINKYMLLKFFKQQNTVPVTLGGLKGYLSRARSDGRLRTDPNHYGHVIAGPVLEPLVRQQARQPVPVATDIRPEDLPF